MEPEVGQLLRALPSVTQLLAGDEGQALAGEFGAGALRLEVRRLLEEWRHEVRTGRRQQVPDAAATLAAVRRRLARLCDPAGRRVLNATGILLHTGLGRAPLCERAVAAMSAVAGYTVLQASLDTGERSLREERAEYLLRELTGCEAATVVNNNAAATLLVLNTLAAGREAVVSRGQLVEIGGSFRLPDVMARSGAVLREVGTTNRTHLRDYEEAVGETTGALLRVHTSNYRIRGFASTPGIRELCDLGRHHSVPVVDDLGSGALVPLTEFGISSEPLVADSVAAGADLVCFSGDKLICGPQCGIICGRTELVQRLRKNPFARMFRVSKFILAGLEATLVHFLNGDYRTALPLYRLLAVPQETLRARARAVLAALESEPAAGLAATVADDVAYVGSGSLPDEGVPSTVVRVRVKGVAADELALRLRLGQPSVFTRVRDDAVLCDLRTLSEAEAQALPGLLRRAIAGG